MKALMNEMRNECMTSRVHSEVLSREIYTQRVSIQLDKEDKQLERLFFSEKHSIFEEKFAHGDLVDCCPDWKRKNAEHGECRIHLSHLRETGLCDNYARYANIMLYT